MSSSLISTFGPSYKPVEIGEIAMLATDFPLVLDSGRKIENFPLAYQTYGKLNADKSNAILIHHGLTGDQYLAGKHPVTGKDGWWEHLVGPGKIIDTDIFFVVCTNVLGGCMGSFGPKNINQETGKPYGLDFPVITIRDMVRAQERFMKILNIKRWLCVMGGSMGGMLTLEWAALYPEKVGSALVIASGARFTAQNIAFHEIGRQAIMADPEWCHGKYLEEKRYPAKGLAVARMTAHLTYMSEDGLQRKFGRALQNREKVTYGFEADFQVESYLRHQGMTFVERFDANSYLYITRAMDYFDLAGEFDGKLAHAFHNTKTHFCVISFSSDWLFTTKETKKIVHALNSSHARISFVEVQTDKGHDAFLLDEPEFFSTLSSFLSRIREEQNA